MKSGILVVGVLRRPRRPAAFVTFNPSVGIEIAGEAVPPDADQAGRWVRAAGGWIRYRPAVLLMEHHEIMTFRRAARRK